MKRAALLCCLLLIIVLPIHAQDTPELEWIECPFALPDSEIEGETIDCAVLYVPEVRSDPDSPIIELAIAILYSASDFPEPDPVLYLEGGPGGSALSGIDMWYTSPLRENRDIVLFDQRGTGYSYPFLGCLVDDTGEEDALELTRLCRDQFILDGVNLSAYNSAASVQDMRDLREALEIDSWNLLGISYGTRLALTAMRDDPTGIRSVILDSVYPPQVQAYEEQSVHLVRALNILFDRCSTDSDCSAAFPDLEEAFYTIVMDFNAEPLLIEEEDPETGESIENEFTGNDFLDAIINALYDTSIIPALPLAIYSLAEGEFDYALELIEGGALMEDADSMPEAEDFSDEGLEIDLSDSDGMNNSVECHEEIPFNNMENALALIEDLPEPLQERFIDDVDQIFGACDFWGAGTPDPIENEAVFSEIPTLVVAGSFDPVTPPEWAEAAAQTLPNSYYYLFENAGHGIMDINTCASGIYLQFLNDPLIEPEASCVTEQTVTFLLP